MSTAEAPEAVLRRFRERLGTSGDILVADPDRVVARFTGKAGTFRYETVELIGFEADRVTFEHLQGPFRQCHERFRVTPTSGGGSVVTHEENFTMRLGLIGWLLGVMVVRPTFEHHVAAHMAEDLA